MVAPFGALMGAVLVGFALLVANRARPDQEGLAMLAVGLLLAVQIALVVLLSVWWVRRRGRRLDAAFAGRGMAGRQAGTRARGWHGTVSGRAFNGWVSRGPHLTLALECDVATRGAVRRAGPVVQALSRRLFDEGRPVEPPAALADCEVLAHDPAWMSRLLARPGVAETVAELMRPTARTAPGLLWTPAAVVYLRAFLPLSEVTEANIDRWTARLSRLADAVEAQGPSPQGLEESRLERWSRTSRRLPVNPIWIGVGCGLVGVGVIAGLSLLLVAWIAR